MEEWQQLEGFIMRPPTDGDAEDVAALVIAYDVEAFGSADYSVEDLRDEWRQPGFVLDIDAVVVAHARWTNRRLRGRAGPRAARATGSGRLRASRLPRPRHRHGPGAVERRAGARVGGRAPRGGHR